VAVSVIARERLAKSSLDRPTGTTDIPAALSMFMRIGRKILTFLVALSLSMAPLAGAFAVAQDEPAVPEASEVVVASTHDCCDPADMPTGPMTNECQASASCLAKCFGLYALELSGPTLPPPTGGTKSYSASAPIYARDASPPFRPPRV
jgi:hypothetical protein